MTNQTVSQNKAEIKCLRDADLKMTEIIIKLDKVQALLTQRIESLEKRP